MSIQVVFSSWQQRASLPLRLFALTDGLLYSELSGSAPMRSAESAIALLDGTPDASLADAGPWLFDYDGADSATRDVLTRLAHGEFGVNWIISAYQPRQLAGELRERLDATLPDGRTAMLRYYDARVMRYFAPALTSTERTVFFSPAFDWLIEIDGQLFRVHPHAA
ncbi:DUF4123 domain-containing protein [Burkholderia multivorans]|uniref:DUF4123 domain-containing protein n=1 Tax=Burkholderia multivorans TaxID=87883 RepID=UPI001C26A043|nr:DUF4123 domain-containing protein [Burkholderia multivorans]MDN7965807.1 DUF4123 domain-containing protein [Burkholderia multivorans]